MRIFFLVALTAIVSTLFSGGAAIVNAQDAAATAPATTASETKTAEPTEEERIYCWGGEISVYVTANAEGDIDFKKSAAGIDLNYTRKAAANSVSIIPAKKCTIRVIPSRVPGLVHFDEVLNTQPEAAKALEPCAGNKQGSVDTKTGQYEKCIQHGESMSREELEAGARQGVAGAYAASESSLREQLQAATDKPNLTGSEVDAITKAATENTHFAELYSQLNPSTETQAVLTEVSTKNAELIQNLSEESTSGFFGLGGGTTNSQEFFSGALDARSELSLPSAADAVTLSPSGDPFAGEWADGSGDFVVGNCGGQPCLIHEQAAGAPASVTGSPNAGSAQPGPNTTFEPGTGAGGPGGASSPITSPVPAPPASADQGFLSKAASSFGGGFLSGLAQGVMQALGLAPQTPAQQAATAQQEQGSNYCKKQFNASFNASKNSCECASGFEFQNNKCVSTQSTTKPTAGEITAELSCAPATADARTPIAIAWSCRDTSANAGNFTVSADGFSAQNKVSGSTRVTAQAPSDGDTMSFKLTCAKGNIQKTDACEVEVRQPALVFVATPNPYTAGQDVTFGWSSFGTAPDAAAGDGRFCTVSSPDVPRISGPGGAGGVRKIQANELLPRTRIFVSCKTQGGNTLEGSMIIADTEEGIQAAQTQLIVDSNLSS